MKCLILAAGYATRLYPLTKNFPKPLLKVGSKTILDWLVDDIDTLKEIDEQRLSSTNYKVIRNYSSGHCISMKSKSNDDEMSVVKDLIYGFVEKFKVPVKGNLVYKGPVDVFTGEREEIIDVYLCQTENVI